MGKTAVRLLALLVLAAPVRAEVAVRSARGRIDVKATRASLADVLDRVAGQTGMKVVYEGPAPRQLVTLALRDRWPAEAVAEILEGQGLNYALVLDASARKVEKLLVTGPALAGTRPPTQAATTRTRPPAPAPDVADEPMVEDPAVVPEVVETPPEITPAPAIVAPAVEAPPGVPTPFPPPQAAPPTQPTAIPMVPPTTYSQSPFNPRPVTMLPTPAPNPTPPPPSAQPQPTPAPPQP